MEVGPILATLRRNRFGAILICVQMALTLAVICNAVFIIQQRTILTRRPSGTDEANIVAITNQWVGFPQDLKARVQTDLASLRALPGVIDVYATNSYPFTGSGSTAAVNLHPDQTYPTELAAAYNADEHTLRVLGLKLIAGRNFTATEVTDLLPGDIPEPTGLIITRTLAEQLFPQGGALGRSVYLSLIGGKSVPIVGVVEKLQVPWVRAGGWGSTFNDNSILQPFHYYSTQYHYLIRVRNGQAATVMTAAARKLFDINRSRVLRNIQSLSDARYEAYRDDRAFATILEVVCVAMLAVTAFGIVGLTSYWVSQRRRQIGIRRALGGTRGAIVRYFQTENFMIALVGSAAGVALTLGVNLWTVNTFAMARLPYGYALAGAFIILLLGQGATLWPALRASLISPALAVRSA